MKLTTALPVLLISSLLAACGGGANIGYNTTNSDDEDSTPTLKQAFTFTHNVIDAKYSDTLEKLISVSSSPSYTLNITDPDTGAETSIALNFTPTSLAISPDGKKAAVGHKNAITYINLETASAISTITGISFKVFDIALKNEGIAYVTLPNDLAWHYLYSIDLNTATIQNDSYNLYGGTHLALLPDQTALYTIDTALALIDIEKFDISSTIPSRLYDSPYNGDYDMGGADNNGIWLTEDGKYILTAGETMFKTSTNQSEDMEYEGSLSDNDEDTSTKLIHADHSQEVEEYIVIKDEGIVAGAASNYSIKTYTTPLLNLQAKLTIDNSNISGFPIVPTFVFFNSDGSSRYSIVEEGINTYFMTF